MNELLKNIYKDTKKKDMFGKGKKKKKKKPSLAEQINFGGKYD